MKNTNTGRRYQPVRIYTGKSLNVWTTPDKNGIERTAQVELYYIDYDPETGDAIADGTEDFSTERLQTLTHAFIKTWDGERRQSGGAKWWTERKYCRYTRGNGDRVKAIAAKWYPDAAAVTIRTF